MLYLLILVLLLLLSYHYDYQHHTKYRREWFGFILIIFILIAGLRYRIGVDSVRYMSSFSDLPNLFELNGFDYDSTRYGRGYLFLNAVVKTLCPDFVAMQFTLACLVNCVLFRFIYQNTPHIFLCTILYAVAQYFNYNFEILRESCAISIFLLSWPFFINGDWLKYYLCSLIAILFHPSAIFILSLPILKLKRLQSLFTGSIITIALLIVVYFISKIIAQVFFEWIRLIELSQIENYANTYENSGYAGEKSYNIIGLSVNLLTTVIYPLAALLLLNSNLLIKTGIMRDKNSNNCLGIMLFCFMALSIASLNLRILYRFTNYFFPFLFIVLADVNLQKVRILSKRYTLSFGIWSLIIFPYIFLNIYGNFSTLGDTGMSKIHRYYPYSSIIFPEMDKTREKLFSLEGA